MISLVIIIVLLIYFVCYAQDHPELLLLLFVAGAIIALVVEERKKKNKYITTDQMTGIQFERYCGKLLKEKYGFLKVEYTKVSGDFGGDLIAYDVDGKKWVIQCKRYSKNVGLEAVQEVLGAYMMYNADRMAVMTTSRLTDGARRLADKSGVKVIENIHGKVEIN